MRSLKVTPLLGVLLFVRWRSARGLLGVAAGRRCWPSPYRPLARPHAYGRLCARLGAADAAAVPRRPQASGLRQTERINQRACSVSWEPFLTDGVAIPAEDPWPTHDIRVGLVHLSPAAFQSVHRAALATVLLVTWFALGAAPAPMARAAPARLV
ncbi:MAG: hypothetical protein R3F17_10635 [Planctomycetota bacterium]